MGTEVRARGRLRKEETLCAGIASGPSGMRSEVLQPTLLNTGAGDGAIPRRQQSHLSSRSIETISVGPLFTLLAPRPSQCFHGTFQVAEVVVAVDRGSRRQVRVAECL